MKTVLKALFIVGPVLYLLIGGLFYLASLATNLLGLPTNLNLPPPFKFAGGALVTTGILLVLWLFRYRKPTDMIVSTAQTFVKMFTRAPLSQPGPRSEPLIINGPQKIVRHPLYLGAAATFIGWSLITGATSTLLGALFALAWIRLVQIPFEEKELRAIFGDQYRKYAHRVPMLLPVGSRKRQSNTHTQFRTENNSIPSHS